MNCWSPLSVIIALAGIGAASATTAAPRPVAPAWPSVTATSAEFGFAFAVPAGVSAQVDRYPHATREQTREVVTLLRDGGEVVRLDVFVDKTASDLETWVRGEFDF